MGSAPTITDETGRQRPPEVPPADHLRPVRQRTGRFSFVATGQSRSCYGREKGGDIAVAPRSPDFDPSVCPQGQDRPIWFRRLAQQRPQGHFASRFRSPGRVVCIPKECRVPAFGSLPCFPAETDKHCIGRVVPAHSTPRGVSRPPAGSRPHRHRPDGRCRCLGYRPPRFPLAVARATAARRRVTCTPPDGTISFQVAPTAKSGSKLLITLRFLVVSSSAYKRDAVIESESRQAEITAPLLWITWISGRKSSFGPTSG